MSPDTTVASPEGGTTAFEARLRALGARYHSHHPFQVMMSRGQLNPLQIQRWVANRYYYQVSIPLKDAALLANCPERELRRQWVRRLLDHDGQAGVEGSTEAWLRLGEACGLRREELADQRHVLPGVRFAVDAYVNFVRRALWQEGVCASLSELFAPDLHRERLHSWPEHYGWIEPEGLAYFRARLGEAPRDLAHALEVVLAHFRSPEQQARALQVLQFKFDVLWAMLDAMCLAYVLKMPPYASVEAQLHSPNQPRPSAARYSS